MLESLGAVGLILAWLFALVLGVLAVLLPLAVFRIWRHTVAIRALAGRMADDLRRLADEAERTLSRD